jgi:hypothetical protein
MSRASRSLLAVLAFVLVLAAGACDGRTPDAISTGERETVPDSGQAVETESTLLVLGRSVMTGWVEYWGGSSSESVVWEGRTVVFREVEGPPGIADSAIDAMSEVPSGSTVLFKFCFVDFNGGDCEGELEGLLGYVEEVADEANARDVRLIVGTALPKVKAETTPELVTEHEEFARRLEGLVAQRREAGEDIAVLDLNEVLADGSGALRTNYAVSRDDSHLNEKAYDALDTALLAVLTAQD